MTPALARHRQLHHNIGIIPAEVFRAADFFVQPLVDPRAAAFAEQQLYHLAQGAAHQGVRSGDAGVYAGDGVADDVEQFLLDINRGGDGGCDVFERYDGQWMAGDCRVKIAEGMAAADFGTFIRGRKKCRGAKAISDDDCTIRGQKCLGFGE